MLWIAAIFLRGPLTIPLTLDQPPSPGSNAATLRSVRPWHPIQAHAEKESNGTRRRYIVRGVGAGFSGRVPATPDPPKRGGQQVGIPEIGASTVAWPPVPGGFGREGDRRFHGNLLANSPSSGWRVPTASGASPTRKHRRGAKPYDLSTGIVNSASHAAVSAHSPSGRRPYKFVKRKQTSTDARFLRSAQYHLLVQIGFVPGRSARPTTKWLKIERRLLMAVSLPNAASLNTSN